MKLFDLHCDTLSEAYGKKEGLENNTCHIDISRARSSFSDYTQVFAIWSRHESSEDECYERCLKILDYADAEFERNKGVTPIYAVEGAKLLNCDIQRLKLLKNRNVKILTLVWRGISCIGGAFDNDVGLTTFGKQTVEYCLDHGIVPDLSHSNDLICEQTLDIATACGGTVIASHSCSRQVFDHPRNISDIIAKRIAEGGGIIGVNFVSDHLGGKSTDVILAHIDHLMTVCGRRSVCLGGDLDGMDNDALPDEIKNIADVSILFDALSKKYRSESLAEDILYSNAHNFAKRCLF